MHVACLETQRLGYPILQIVVDDPEPDNKHGLYNSQLHARLSHRGVRRHNLVHLVTDGDLGQRGKECGCTGEKHVDAEEAGAQHAPPRTGVRSRVSSEQLVSTAMPGVQEGQVRGKVLSKRGGRGG